MSLGSRIATRGKEAVAASLASTPREPLLFLYPSWCRNSSTAIPTSNRDHPRRQTTPTNLSTRPSRRAIHTTSLNGSQSQDSSVLLFKERPAQQPTKSRFGPQLADLSKLPSRHTVERQHTESSSLADVTNSQRNNAPSSIRTPKSIEKRVKKAFRTRQDAQVHRRFNENARKDYNYRLLVQKAYQKGNIREPSPDELARNSNANQISIDMQMPDWREMLATLTANTIEHGPWLEKSLEVHVSQQSFESLLLGVDNTIHEIASRHGCSVHLGERLEPSHRFRTFLLSGSVAAMGKTVADVFRIAPDVEFKRTTVINNSEWRSITSAADDSLGESPMRHVLAYKNGIERVRPQKPSKWTKESFRDYVQAVVFSAASNHDNHLNGGYNPREEVPKILDDLFNDPNCQAVISRQACNLAAVYYEKANLIKPLRELFTKMSSLGLANDPQTYNIIFRGIAKAQNLQAFRFILGMMVRNGVKANHETWLAFMASQQNVDIKVQILAAMKKVGLLGHKSTLKAVSRQLVREELELALEVGEDISKFMRYMDHHHGVHWLSTDSANVILNVLGGSALRTHMRDFIAVMDDRFIKFDNCTVNTLLHHCQHDDTMDSALRLLRDCKIKSIPDQETYRILFRLAWRKKHLNLAKVVWKYACLSANTTSNMRWQVMRSLLWPVARTPGSMGEQWRRFAGRVITAQEDGIQQTEEDAGDDFERSHSDNNTNKESIAAPLSNLSTLATSDPSTLLIETVESTMSKNDSLSDVPKPESSLYVPEEDISMEDEETRDLELSVKLDELMNPSVLENSGIGRKTSDSQKTKVRAAQNILRQDLELCKNHEPVLPLVDMLNLAWKRDLSWENEKTASKMGLYWVMQNADNVPLRRKTDRPNSEKVQRVLSQPDPSTTSPDGITEQPNFVRKVRTVPQVSKAFRRLR